MSEMTAEIDLPDNCVNCAKRLGRNRFDVISTATAVVRSGGGGVKASYRCPYIGHVWTCCWSESVFTERDDRRLNEWPTA